jgi:hypothetical protein
LVRVKVKAIGICGCPENLGKPKNTHWRPSAKRSQLMQQNSRREADI